MVYHIVFVGKYDFESESRAEGKKNNNKKIKPPQKQDLALSTAGICTKFDLDRQPLQIRSGFLSPLRWLRHPRFKTFTRARVPFLKSPRGPSRPPLYEPCRDEARTSGGSEPSVGLRSTVDTWALSLVQPEHSATGIATPPGPRGAKPTGP